MYYRECTVLFQEIKWISRHKMPLVSKGYIILLYPLEDLTEESKPCFSWLPPVQFEPACLGSESYSYAPAYVWHHISITSIDLRLSIAIAWQSFISAATYYDFYTAVVKQNLSSDVFD